MMHAAPDMIPSDDEVDDQCPNIHDSDIENTESLRVFIKHTIKKLIAAESSDSEKIQKRRMTIKLDIPHLICLI